MRNLYLILILLSIFLSDNRLWSAEIQIGETKFQGTVSVYEDGTVETTFPEKEVDVEGEGRKRVKIKFLEGKFALVDSATNEEMTVGREGKFIKKSKLLAIQTGPLPQETATISQISPPSTSPSILPAFPSEKDLKVEQKETPQKKEPLIDISIFDVSLPSQIFVGQQTDIKVVILNDSEIRLNDCLLAIEIDDGFRDKKLINLNPHQRQIQIFRWLPQREGRFRFTATIKAPQEIEEKNTRNNEKTILVQILSSSKEEIPSRPQESGTKEEGSIPKRGSDEPSRSPQGRDRTPRY